MAKIAEHDLSIIQRIIFFLAAANFIDFLLPSVLQFINIFSMTLIVGSSVGVTAACVISTGIPCALALSVSAIVNVFASGILSALGIDISKVPVLSAFVTTTPFQWVTSLIMLPITIIIQLYLARLARGL